MLPTNEDLTRQRMTKAIRALIDKRAETNAEWTPELREAYRALRVAEVQQVDTPTQRYYLDQLRSTVHRSYAEQNGDLLTTQLSWDDLHTDTDTGITWVRIWAALDDADIEAAKVATHKAEAEAEDTPTEHNNWYVQEATGQIYGPDSRDNCMRFAETLEGESKVVAACDVDGQLVEAATKMKAWYVHRADGVYNGPYRLMEAKRAAQYEPHAEIVAARDVPPGSTVFNVEKREAEVSGDDDRAWYIAAQDGRLFGPYKKAQALYHASLVPFTASAQPENHLRADDKREAKDLWYVQNGEQGTDYLGPYWDRTEVEQIRIWCSPASVVSAAEVPVGAPTRRERVPAGTRTGRWSSKRPNVQDANKPRQEAAQEPTEGTEKPSKGESPDLETFLGRIAEGDTPELRVPVQPIWGEPSLPLTTVIRIFNELYKQVSARWIDIDDQMPSPYTLVWAYRQSHGEPTVGPRAAFWSTKTSAWYGIDGRRFQYQMTNWTPLRAPALPRKEDDGHSEED